jgi:hypothetical protein
MLQFARSNPWRAPHWRWGRALGIVEGRQPGTTARRDGKDGYKWINRTVAYLEAYITCQDDFSRMSLAMDEPDLFWAHWAYMEQEHPAKAIIEARVMARDTPTNIGFYSNCAVEIVHAYEALFFDVRENLNRKDYVNSVIFGHKTQEIVRERNYSMIWKLLGYAGGPHVLDAAMSKLTTPNWVNNPEHVPSFFQEAALSTIKKKAALAAMTVDVNTNTQLDLLATFVKFVEIERTTESAGKVQDQVISDLNTILTSLPWKRAGVAGPPAGPAYDYDVSAVELTVDQLLLIGTGEELKEREALLATTFPEHTKPTTENAEEQVSQ